MNKCNSVSSGNLRRHLPLSKLKFFKKLHGLKMLDKFLILRYSSRHVATFEVRIKLCGSQKFVLLKVGRDLKKFGNHISKT